MLASGLSHDGSLKCGEAWAAHRAIGPYRDCVSTTQCAILLGVAVCSCLPVFSLTLPLPPSWESIGQVSTESHAV